MSKQLKLRRGTTAQHSTFTGAEGEVTVDTTKDTLVVHDGVTAGGSPLAKEASTSPQSISVSSTEAAMRITQLGTGNALLVEDETNPDSTPFVVTADGRVITGTTQAYAADGDTQQLQVHGLTQASSSALFANWSATATSEPNLALAHSRSGVVGTHTASVANDNLGNIIFCGSDGSVFSAGAAILAEAEGTWSGSSTPARVAFFTVPSGSTNGVERARIDSTGQQSSVIPGGTTLYKEYKCRAWVNFNGTGSVAIRASGNVSSITDNGTGLYTVNFTTAMPDVNYSISGLTGPNTSDTAIRIVDGGYLTSSVSIRTQTLAGVAEDRSLVVLQAFR